MQGIFGQATNSIDFRQVMDTGKIIILNLSDVGIFNAAFIGAFAVFGIWQAALSRTNIPEAERRTFHLYADEFQDYMTTFFPVMQLQGRKFGLDTVVAHQNRGSLNADLRSSTLSVVNKIVFRTNSDDASTLAPGFKTKGIEERTIERPKRTYVLNVLAHLATHGHSNPAFQEPYRKLRADIDEIFTEHLNIVQDLKPTPQQLNIPDITPATARSFFVEKKAQLEEEINRFGLRFRATHQKMLCITYCLRSIFMALGLTHWACYFANTRFQKWLKLRRKWILNLLSLCVTKKRGYDSKPPCWAWTYT
jgi:hypothetical protein